MVENSNGREGVGPKKKKKKSTQCLAMLREIFSNNNTYSLNKLGPNMKI